MLARSDWRTPLRGFHTKDILAEATAKKAWFYKNEKLNKLTKQLFEVAVNTFQIEINENYQLQFNLGDFLNSISEVDLRRIKKCEDCSNILWAYRLNTKFCSKKCSNSHHQRIFQNKTETKEKKRTNYYYKNKIDYCEKCSWRLVKCQCE